MMTINMSKEAMAWRATLALNHLVEENPSKFDHALRHAANRGWFVGQVMRITEGVSDLETVEAVVSKRFGGIAANDRD